MKKIPWIGAALVLITGCANASTTRPNAGAQVDGAAVASPRLDELRPDEEISLDPVSADEARRLELSSIVRALDGLDADQASMDIAADPNMRPIRIWFVKGRSGIAAAYVVGHADGECCPLISGLVSDVAMSAGFEDGWFSYGYGHLTADTPSEERALEKLQQDIAAKSTTPACAGQVVLSTDAEDTIGTASAGLTSMGERAYARATSLSRPLMIWSQLDDRPRIVPALVSEGGAMKPLRFKISKDDLAAPAAVLSGFSLSGVAEGIASLEASIPKLTKLSQATDLLAETTTHGWTTNYRAPEMEPAVLAANARIDAAIAAWKARPAKDSLRAPMLAMLAKLKPVNDLAIAKIRALPLQAKSDKRTSIEYKDVTLADETIAAIKSRLAEAQASLIRLRAMAASPMSKPEPVLTDALLRGWPATVSTPKVEEVFDKWVGERQKVVWQKVRRDLESRGVHLSAGPAGAPSALTLSNVVFRVTQSGSELTVTPYFILAGPVVQVADPAAGIVRYEAAAADQNLIDLAHAEGK